MTSTVTLHIDEVLSTKSLSHPKSAPIAWPSAGDTIEVGYPPGEAGELRVGERYDVEAARTDLAQLPWRSTALAWYSTDFGLEVCGAEHRPAKTTFVGGSSIEPPSRTFVRGSVAALRRNWPPVVVATVAVAATGAGIIGVRRARRRRRIGTLEVPGAR